MENLKVEGIEFFNEGRDEEITDVNEPTELKQFRYKYWSDFLNYINQTEYKELFKTEGRKPSDRKYFDIYLGVTNCNLYIDYNRDDDVSYVNYWVGRKDLYDKFKSHKAELEQECGALQWIEMKKASKIRKEIFIVGKTQEEQFKLYMDELVKMHEFFVRYIK